MNVPTQKRCSIRTRQRVQPAGDSWFRSGVSGHEMIRYRLTRYIRKCNPFKAQMCNPKASNPTRTPFTRCMLSLFALCMICAGLISLVLIHANAAQATETRRPNILIVYFSHSGNTRMLAEMIQHKTQADILELKTAHTYPDTYRATTDQARQELNTGFRPQLVNENKDLKSYDVVCIGFPIWWGTMPTALFSFLESHDLSGKTIAPFCTHGGSGLGHSTQDLARLCPKSKISEGLAVRGRNADHAGQEVDTWLRAIGLAQ